MRFVDMLSLPSFDALCKEVSETRDSDPRVKLVLPPVKDCAESRKQAKGTAPKAKKPNPQRGPYTNRNNWDRVYEQFIKEGPITGELPWFNGGAYSNQKVLYFVMKILQLMGHVQLKEVSNVHDGLYGIVEFDIGKSHDWLKGHVEFLKEDVSNFEINTPKHWITRAWRTQHFVRKGCNHIYVSTKIDEN